MAASSRQSDLFAGESWDVIYQAYTQINFNASDPVSINAALCNYIQVNYPEDYNDWIISSEFVAIIDLLSWLAGTLAFKSDIAARENFLDTAQARESILRLARFLSYNPSRCQSATGIVKLVAVETDDHVYDSFGVDQANTRINWNDQNNANWFEQFTAVLTNAFVGTNPFGVPLKEGTVGGISTQLYRFNATMAANNLGFNATVSGSSMDFEVCNADFVDQGSYSERSPNPNAALHLYYLNDGNGYASSGSGFFLLFKQGTTQQQIFNVTVPVENQLIDITASNINQTDVWVQSLNQDGTVQFDWTQVPIIANSNITYNNVPVNQRNIFAVLTRDNDQVTIRFSDGQFGNAPSGLIGVSFRVANGLQYLIKPLEINNVTLPISFTNSIGNQQTIYLTFSLYETVSNAAAAETLEQIRQRAPQVYATQNRMVSGEDYNTYPLSSNLAVKIKAVNRVYSGQSRYVDLHDPTGTYQDLSIFADDGIFFKDAANSYLEIPPNLIQNADQLISNYIIPTIDQYTVTNLLRDVLLQNVLNGSIASAALVWQPSSANAFANTGYFQPASGQVNVDPVTAGLIQPGATIQFSINGTPTWVPVLTVQGAVDTPPFTNTAGPVSLQKVVPAGSTILAVIPTVSLLPSSATISQINANISIGQSFSLSYNYTQIGTDQGPWRVTAARNSFGAPAPSLTPTGILVMLVNSYNMGNGTLLWRVNTRGLRYVFESVSTIEWFDNGVRSLAQNTGEFGVDTVRVMRINRDLNNVQGYALQRDYNIAIDRLWLYPDGTPEPRRSVVALLDADGDGDGYPIDPDLYYKVVSATQQNTYLFWTNRSNPPYETPLNGVIVYETDTLRASATPPTGTIGFQLSASSALLQNTFWVYTASGWQQDLSNTYRVAIGRGPNVAAAWVTFGGTLIPDGDSLLFHWKHYAASDHRIDPAVTNIHDIFVLTSDYDTAVRQWVSSGAPSSSMPTAPTELDLRLAFSNLEEFKMFSDELVWRPVRYRFLFGSTADPELQGQFQVVRLPNVSVSDGEIKTQIINAINTYFAVNNWDFGETFYFTEMAAYVHQQLVGLIGSIVLVPLAADGTFGDGFEVSCQPDEIFLSTAQVSDVVIIPSNTAISMRQAPPVFGV